MDNSIKNYHRLAVIALILAVFVIMLGAYTRLTDAGLGCPDWPGCYGQIVLPNNQPGLGAAQKAYPHQPLVVHKAWTEMVHRYVAGTLGILIIILAGWAVFNKKRGLMQPMVTPFLLVAVLIFQALLGMWTVTLKLLPLVVTGHLLGGMAIAGLLCWLASATRPDKVALNYPAGVRSVGWIMTLIGFIILIIQIFLGAWTSTNYAALACGADFPNCQGIAGWPIEWERMMNVFNIFNPIGPNYEGGRLEMVARQAIQMAHRYWAVITLIYLGLLGVVGAFSPLRRLAQIMLVLLIIQIGLGILNVVKLLPLWIAVAHNGVAVLLLISVAGLLQRLYEHRKLGYLEERNVTS